MLVPGGGAAAALAGGGGALVGSEKSDERCRGGSGRGSKITWKKLGARGERERLNK